MKKTALITAMCIVLSIFTCALPIYAEENYFEQYEEMSSDMLSSYLSGALDSETSYSSNLYEYDSFLEAYYDNLTYNFGVNYKNSCGYIALGMLLSYYDTYLNDDIIPEQYDISSVGVGTDMIERRNSPGIFRDIIENQYDSSDTLLNGLSATDYYSIIQSMSNFSLHAKLITIGASEGYYNFDNDLAPALTSLASIIDIVSIFLNDISQVSDDDYDILYAFTGMTNGFTSNDLRNATISMIQAGHPVLLGVGVPNQKDGHAVIAYDYDSENDIVYCHFGFGANETHIPLDLSGFTEYRTAMVIDFNVDDNPGCNYGVTTIANNIPSTEYYSYDDCRIFTYADTHSYDYDYINYNAYKHVAYCECGEYVLEDHLHLAPSYDCVLCGAEHTHTYGMSYEWVSDKIHTTTCVCGETKSEGHVVSATALPIHGRKVCLLCGGLASEGLSQMAVGSLPHTENGSYITSDGIIVLADEDIEAFLNGTLEFIYPSVGETS